MNAMAELLESLATDAGGPGEFRYDGGPKPYVKKSGEVSETSKERVEQAKQGQLEKPEPQAEIPQLTPEQQQIVGKLSQQYQKRIQTQVEAYRHWSVNETESWERASLGSELYSQNAVISKSESKFLREYQKKTAFDLNEYERTGNPSNRREETLKSNSETLSNLIGKFTVNENHEIYRGLNAYTSEKAQELDNLLESKPGDILSNKGFSSGSLHRDNAEQFAFRGQDFYEKGVVLEITLKKGQHALSANQALGSKSVKTSFNEVILNKNSDFRVDSVDKENRIIKLTLLDKRTAVDSIALDYTFIPEEHPRQNDPDWGGKPQEGGTSTPILPKVDVPSLPPEQQEKVNELASQYSKTISDLVNSIHSRPLSGLSHQFSKFELTPKEEESVLEYARIGYMDWNPELRDDPTTTSPELKDVANAISKSTLNEPLTVYRYSENGEEFYENFAEDFQEGDKLTSKGFLSTSTDAKGLKDSPYQYIVHLPKGMAALPIGLIPGIANPDEHEVLLNHGTKFKIRSIEEVEDGTRIELEATSFSKGLLGKKFR